MKVWVELDECAQPVRIFKSYKSMATETSHSYWAMTQMEKKLAVSHIRKQIYDRQNGVCFYCPQVITLKAHLHEKLFRGRGGEISTENSVMSCADCHIGPVYGQHPEKQLRFTKRTEKK